MRATPYHCPIRHRGSREPPEGPGLGRTQSKTQSDCAEEDSLFRLIRNAAQPDELIGLDQNGDDDAEESQASGEVEPGDADPAGLTKPRCSGRRRANRKQ